MSSAEMRVLLAALCFAATEPQGFSSTEQMMRAPHSVHRLFIICIEVLCGYEVGWHYEHLYIFIMCWQNITQYEVTYFLHGV